MTLISVFSVKKYFRDGCGHNFNITNAPKYIAKSARDRTVEAMNVEKPEEETKHEIMEGLNLTCDVCTEDIFGPRFECIHCPSYNCCATCEIRLSEGNPPLHSPNHVFRLHMRASEGTKK